MKKQIFAIIAISALVFSCSSGGSPSDPTQQVTKYIPSLMKTVLNGKSPVSAQINAQTKQSREAVAIQAPTEQGGDADTYNIAARLKDTVWFQSEEDYDDGKIEVETEYIFFSAASEIFEREVENGITETPEEDDYGTLEFIADVYAGSTLNETSEVARNAGIVKRVTTETDNGRPETELDYIGLYLHDAETLFVVDEDSQDEAAFILTSILDAAKAGTISPYMKEEYQYILSTEKINK